MREMNCDISKKKYQVLSVFVLDDNFGDFTRCEENWLELDASRAQTMFEVALKSADQLHKEVQVELRVWGTVEKLMSTGKAVRVYDTIFRESRDQKACPLCGSYIEGDGAISRLDNQTMICSDCGQREALNDMLGLIRE